MFKNVLIYLAGVVTGLVLLPILAALYSNNSDMILFDEEGECISSNSFKIFCVLENGNALATEIYLDHSIATGIDVMFLSNKKTSYYDRQIIEIPQGKCAKQIGVFKYKTRIGMDRTVPIVRIREI